MTVQYPLFPEFAADLDADKRIMLLDAVLEKFDARETIHIATALLVDAHVALSVKRGSYALNGWIVTVENVRAT